MKTISGTINAAPDAVTLIDAHHHLWDLSMTRHPWLGAHPEKNFFLGDYAPIKRNYLPADYLKDSAGHNVLATVHCEAEWDRADQVGETRWISAIHARHGFHMADQPPSNVAGEFGHLALHAVLPKGDREIVFVGLEVDIASAGRNGVVNDLVERFFDQQRSIRE